MSGFSVYLGEKTDYKYIQSMIDIGYKTVFTSLQIPEEDTTTCYQQLSDLLYHFQHDQLTFIIDVNPSKLNHSFYQLLSEYPHGNYVIRLDQFTSLDLIKEFTAKGFYCCLNASTISRDLLNQLSPIDNFKNIVYCHNYYPRPDTGLNDVFVKQQNQLIREFNPQATIYGFISGTEKRGPLFKGLPTLEANRKSHPIFSAQHLIDTEINHVIVGDIQLQLLEAKRLYKAIHQRHFTLTITLTQDSNANRQLINAVHTVRYDGPESVIRSQEARSILNDTVTPAYCYKREVGSITIDNCLNGRYEGELQIIKDPLPSHPHVNCVGMVSEKDLEVLNCLSSNDTFDFAVET
ncbi:MupG family TIM beta-alpha barrel fold protein [Staphylococcus sp. SQ8-PEA]|uniref:MupG family TIM beta-alpha barrel fold protein n=1 Tax=Staphylococcus marylandisciuri TaxID=2981529 RepID=A0ABT2QML2_9STAP|nr:MupG family TIM beta-alpha barrel fold protein [Staphylococcus marylandisciuri]MCU5745218.1 MupG family TIM beta-alpha barrel fold protein [Staphylococcus marylandisciuri]